MMNSELICKNFTEKIAKLLVELKTLDSIKKTKIKEAVGNVNPQELRDGYKIDSIENVKTKCDKDILLKQKEIENLKADLYKKYDINIKNEAKEWYKNKDGELRRNIERALNRESGILLYFKFRYSDLFQNVYNEVGEEYYVKF